MVKTVGVFNAPPVYLLGLNGLLSSFGYALESVDDPVGWLRRNRRGAMLVTVDDESDLNVVVDLKSEAPESVVVTLIDEVNVSAIQASLSAGAAGSIPRDARAADVVLAFNAAMSDNVLIPAPVARALAARGETDPPPQGIGDEEVSWLRSLSQGLTVSRLAEAVGYSEREMYRRLRRLYSRLGADGRTEALLMAARFGWLV